MKTLRRLFRPLYNWYMYSLAGLFVDFVICIVLMGAVLTALAWLAGV